MNKIKIEVEELLIFKAKINFNQKKIYNFKIKMISVVSQFLFAVNLVNIAILIINKY